MKSFLAPLLAALGAPVLALKISSNATDTNLPICKGSQVSDSDAWECDKQPKNKCEGYYSQAKGGMYVQCGLTTDGTCLSQGPYCEPPKGDWATLPSKTCKGSPYTFDTKKKCDGFSGLTLEQCQQKCANSAKANNCPQKTCGGAVFYPKSGWCHLYEHGQCTEFKDRDTATAIVEKMGWKLVFRQTNPYQWKKNVWSLNPGDPSAANYAILDQLDDMKVDGSFKFKLTWPGAGIKDQIWKQTSNPVKKNKVKGYDAVAAPHSKHKWGGIMKEGKHCLIDGSTNGWWFYAVGTFKRWQGGYPGPDRKTNKVELYAWTDTTLTTTKVGWRLVFQQTLPYRWPKNQCSKNPHNPTASNFAILDKLDTMKFNGGYKFKLSWPGSGIADQVWKQLSNPAKESKVKGYEAVDAPHSKNKWGGIMKEGKRCLIDGSTDGRWFYAVGTYGLWSNGYPGPDRKVDKVQLWAWTSLSSAAAAAPEWKLVFRQTMPYVWPKNQWSKNPTNPASDNYAILDKLEDFRVDGSFKFKLTWPGGKIKDQVWRQTSNPVKEKSVKGYDAIDAPHNSRNWAGLMNNGGHNCLLDGSKGGWWFYAVGSYSKWNNGYPGPNNAMKKVELWVFA